MSGLVTPSLADAYGYRIVTGARVAKRASPALTTARSPLEVTLPPDATRPARVVYTASSRRLPPQPPLGAWASAKTPWAAPLANDVEM